MKPSRLLFYGRAGFEKEIAQEITARAAGMGCGGFVKAKPDSGFAVFHPHEEALGVELGAHIDYGQLVFPRQMVRVAEMLTALPETDRAGPIAQAASERPIVTAAYAAPRGGPSRWVCTAKAE